VLQGTIDEFPLIDVLGILQARNKTGRLEIERQAGRGLIYVRLGEPYYAESSLTRSLIGQKLVEIGAITDMQLRKALDHQAESGERLGQILLTNGVISADDVAQAVISQIKDALADLLAWEAGEFRWETGAEVEVEVPLFGSGNGSTGEGSNPLAPHVVPIHTKEPDTGLDSAEPEAVVAHTDFPEGGTTMTGNEVTAKSIESVPEAGQDPSPEVVHSSSEVVEDAAVEAPEPKQAPVAELDAPTEPEPETEEAESEPEPETEEAESEPEPETEEAEPEPEPVAELNENEPEPVPVNEFDAQTEPEAEEADEADPEPVAEFDAQTEPEPEAEEAEEVQEAEPEPEDEVEETKNEVEETVPVYELHEDEEEDQDDESVSEAEPETEPVAEDGDAEPEETGLPLALAPVVHTEVPEQFHVPVIIRSQPAPELDEEFEAVFEATDRASFEVEPLPEPEAVAPSFDPTPAIAPVFGADAFTPIAPVAEFDHPTFVPDRSADPVFDHGNFEPLPENPEPLFGPVADTTDDLADEDSEPPFGPVAEPSDEPVDEAPDLPFEPVAETSDEPVVDALEPPYWPVETADEQDESLDDAPGSAFDPVALESPHEALDEAPAPPPHWPTETTDEQGEHVEQAPESAFTAVVETFDSTSPEPEVETPQPAFEMPFEHIIEPVVPDAPEPVLVEPQPAQMAPELPAADLMPVASPPPPPPEVNEPNALEDVPAEKAPDAPPGPVTPESLKDIKLDRSSLVRELSDLLR
jgi:hypothetical protein